MRRGADLRVALLAASLVMANVAAAAPTAAAPATAGSAWYSDGTTTKSGGAGTQVRVYALGAVRNLPYRLVLGTGGCATEVARLNPTNRYANTSGFLATTVGTIPEGVAAGTYAVCFLSTLGEPTSTSVLTFTVPDINPGLQPPALDPTVATNVFGATSFLYTGPNAIQTGVAPGTIEPVRASVVRGRVLVRGGQPLGGVAVTVVGHPELGQTRTRVDGAFDMAVNGGGTLTVGFAKDGFPAVERQADPRWGDYDVLDDVVMIPYDTKVTTVDFSAPVTVAQGTPVTDDAGTRTATLLFAQGTQATMSLPDGSTRPLGTVHVRATEYTVGPDGPKAMPGDLPASSGYTYAVEFSVDEAVAAGATQVNFSQPVASYTENFLQFPVGGIVPSGYFDRQRGLWVPSPNGRVVKVLGVSAGKADLDVIGNDQPADAAALAALGRDRRRARKAGRPVPAGAEPVAGTPPPLLAGLQLAVRPARRRQAAPATSTTPPASGRALPPGWIYYRVREPVAR